METPAAANTEIANTEAEAVSGEDINLTVATSNLTGTWYIWGGALSKVITEKIPGYTASPQVTDGPLANLQMLENDEIMLTLGNTTDGSSFVHFLLCLRNLYQYIKLLKLFNCGLVIP